MVWIICFSGRNEHTRPHWQREWGRERERARELASRIFGASTTVWRRTTTDFWVVLRTVTGDTQMTQLIATRSRFLLECLLVMLECVCRFGEGQSFDWGQILYVIFWIFGGGWNQGGPRGEWMQVKKTNAGVFFCYLGHCGGEELGLVERPTIQTLFRPQQACVDGAVLG